MCSLPGLNLAVKWNQARGEGRWSSKFEIELVGELSVTINIKTGSGRFNALHGEDGSPFVTLSGVYYDTTT